jgi:hypothetical protein
MQAQFCNHTIIDQNPDDYLEISCSTERVLQAWRESMFAHELMNNDGTVKDESELNGDTLHKYIDAKERLNRGEQLPKPVLGIGIFDGIEIGIGREIIAAAYHGGIKTIPANVRKAQAEEIENLLA